MTAAEFDQRITMALKAMEGSAEFAAALMADVNAFFTRHPEITRTPAAEAICTVIVFERLSHADGQSATQTQKTA